MKKNNTEAISNSFSTINTTTTIKGEIMSNNDLRIDGIIEGNVESKAKIVFGPSAQIKGNIVCKNADISCNVVGNIYVEELLTLKSSAHITGDLFTQKLVVENGAVFIGKCEMGDIRNATEKKPQNPEILKTSLLEEQ